MTAVRAASKATVGWRWPWSSWLAAASAKAEAIAAAAEKAQQAMAQEIAEMAKTADENDAEAEERSLTDIMDTSFEALVAAHI